MNRSFFFLLASSFPLLAIPVAYPQPAAGHEAAAKPAMAAKGSRPGSEVIARVGDQPITWGEVNVMLNSSPVVGVSIPAVGTPQREKAIILLLDKFISANLLYLDALKQGLDKDPVYQRDIDGFQIAMLAGLYRRREMIGDVQVSKQEVQDAFNKSKKEGAELTPDVRHALESVIRRQKIKQRLTDARKHLRDGVKVVVYEKNIAMADDAKRPDSAVVAEINGKPVTWGEVKQRIIAAGNAAVKLDPLAMEDDARAKELQGIIDLRIMAEKARAAGLDQDRRYQARLREYRKTRLITLYRERLIARLEPSKEALKAYYEANKARFVQPAARKVQMVVVKTQKEAEDLKAKIQAGKMTMYQAAQKYSIAPRAKQNLGEVGWVSQGKTFPALDKVIFNLGPGEVGGPVHIAAGWELVTVQDAAEAKFDDFDDATTQSRVRGEYLNDKLNAYSVKLRKDDFPVVVYQDVLARLSQREADAVARLAKKAKQPGSLTQKRVKELEKEMRP